MGLSVEVGLLADLLEHDGEGAKLVKDHFSEINELLNRKGFSSHKEPTKCEVWSLDGYGYSGLHALREIAGLIWKGKKIPRNQLITGRDKTPYSEELFNEALEAIDVDGLNLVSRILRKIRKNPLPSFTHLVLHSDSAGYYLPIDFSHPIMPKVFKDETAHLWPLGSVPKLEQEVKEIITHLQIPNSLNSSSMGLQTFLDSPNQNPDCVLWEAQPIAAYSALMLLEACNQSKKTGAAIAFV